MKKIILSAIFAGFLFSGGFSIINNDSIVFAQTTETSKDAEDYSDFEGIIPSSHGTDVSNETKALSDRIKNGSVGLGDIIIILVKMIDMVSKFAGTVAVLFLIYGGYQYMLGGVTEDEGAKNTIKYAIMGLIVTFMAYVIVNLIKVQFLG